MTDEKRIFGYLQAGGGSRRFGSDKALSLLGGRTLLERTAELVSSVCGNLKIVAATGKYRQAPAEIVADRWPGEGPLGGILTALAESSRTASQTSLAPLADSHWNLIVGCDMPFLTRDWLECLCARALASEAQVVVAESGNGLEPLCACWNGAARPALQAAFDSGVRKVTEAMKRVPLEVLDVTLWKRFDTDGRLFWNMNTPEDFAAARKIIEAENQ
jgi:molybdopterin-guanine dinucleotide biosynthesis protein A